MSDYYRKSVSAVCPDGKVRKVSARHYWDGRRHCLAADSFFSVPAGLKFRGKYVHGYVTGVDDEREDGVALEFRPHTVCDPWLAAS